MKGTLTLIMITLFAVGVHASGSNDSKLAVTVAGTGNIQVVIDNHRYQQHGNTVMVNDLEPGRHSIQVFTMRSGIRQSGNRRNDKGTLVYSATIYVRPRQFVDIVINRFGKALVEERSLMTYNEDNARYDEYGYGNDHPYAQEVHTVRDQEFAQMRDQLRRQPLEHVRMNRAHALFQQHHFLSRQVHQLLQLFSFEGNKLHLAKAAYGNTTDKNNFYLIHDVFSFDRSREELTRYIENFRWRGYESR